MGDEVRVAVVCGTEREVQLARLLELAPKEEDGFGS